MALVFNGVAPRLTRVHQIDTLAWAPLLAASEAEGRRMLRRLLDEWRSGANRYDRPGESLWAWQDAQGLVIAAGGLNVEPAPGRPGTARMRRFYVHPAWRERGLAHRLVQAALASAQGHFERLHVNCESDESAEFWQRCGFVPAPGPGYTHVRLLPRLKQAA